MPCKPLRGVFSIVILRARTKRCSAEGVRLWKAADEVKPTMICEGLPSENRKLSGRTEKSVPYL